MSARARAGLALALALVVVVTAWITRATEGRHALLACDAAFSRGERVEAIAACRVAAEARCPLCASPDLAFARLAAIAKDAENRGDDASAVAAWRAVRTATLATLVLEAATAERARADLEIARLEHRIDAAAAAAGAASSPAASEARLRETLGASGVPSGLVFLLLSVGGALLVGGAIHFVRTRTFGVSAFAMSVLGGAVVVVAALLF